MKTLAIAFGLALLSAAGSAGAADLYQPEPAPQPEPIVQPVAASGWYLRGDVGYAFGHSRGGYYFPDGNYKEFDHTKLDDSWFGGAGIGYQVTKHFRVDFTGDYGSGADFKGHSECGDSSCYSNDTSSAHMLSLLANAYVDLGTYYGITPYVGAGIGGTHIDFGKFTSSTHCGGSACGGAYDLSFDYDGKSDWRFTYALMAGASVDLTCNLKFDTSYRYRHVSGGGMSENIVASDAYANPYGRSYDKGIDLHDVRAGLRYTFGGCAQPAPVYATYEQPSEPVYK
ncbi:outer membrane protein [Pararhizobium mangrovi]|uniref:Porin family protein n=1 Tax=Pararhizobium mangrovi TaxID=2590452 RepID=A0A506UHC4_9HYPH|nr:outer membrane protein [Pararhizobium mangrovi]TPW32708.1 porin family protein [Pararhizobium mangrovi]